MGMHQFSIYGVLWMVGTLLTLTSCRTGSPHALVPLSQSDLQTYFSTAQDPRRYWLTTYQSDQGPTFTGGFRLHPEQYCQLPFQTSRKSAAPIIELRSSTPDVYYGLIDTSSSDCWVDYPTARLLPVIPLGPPAYELNPLHLQDNIKGYLSLVEKLRLDKLHIENSLIYTKASYGDLGPLARQQHKNKPQLILGTRLLRTFAFVHFNYQQQQVLFSSTQPYPRPTDRLVAATPFTLLDGGYACEGYMDGQRTTFLIDTAGDYECALPIPPSTGVNQLMLGDLVIIKPTIISLTDEHAPMLSNRARIGNKLLAKFNMTIDNKEETIYFERPADK